jgi:arsenate reductase-like glutaredoxin family protein
MDHPDKDFWQKASSTVEFLLNNHVKFHLDDLLEDLPECPSPYKELPRLAPLHLKSSSLDTSYRNYNEKLMKAVERSKKFNKINEDRLHVKTPQILRRTAAVSLNSENRDSFQVSGKKAKILMNLPEKDLNADENNDLNTRLKEFIGKVHDKYANLVKALEFKAEHLNFEAVVEYLKKSSILLKRPTYTRDRQRVYSKSPSSYKATRLNLSEITGYGLNEKVQMLKVTGN